VLENTEEDVIRVIQETLELSDGVISIESVADEIPEWDSLGHLAILSNLDKHFEGQVASIQELASVDNIKDLIKILHDNSLI